MLWIETPTNPLMKVVDIGNTVRIVKRRGPILVVVDNTFLTPYLQRPLEFGADIVVYSLTKYMNGHSDVVMGAAVVDEQAVAEKLRFLQNGKIIIIPLGTMINNSRKYQRFRDSCHCQRLCLRSNAIQREH